ncbi:T9SS type A sorting domain-containing protein [Fulvivirga ulvae]|uniref:pectate lyase family protein n=1 Tax=Fulvivirga ulvae TaxID=2904245 RepID=UPI001F3B8379|nr:T9SS type A sorting domain-containing protein [Fulvivirga ulvae]UII29589.1 T9SS type A sorting domain-containing protein [Fulvivirga ulvae]
MKRILYLILPILFLTVGNIYSQDVCAPVGWATQSMNVTGGGDAIPVVVENYNELKNALKSSSVKVVHISGTITIPPAGLIYFQDQADKTIFGLPGSKLVSTDRTSAGSGILIVKRCNNVIIRNLTFEGPGAYDVDGYDNLLISKCTNVWVDHCSFYDGVDGNFDINNGSDLISVTWCKFGYNKDPLAGGSGGSNDHRFTNLIGSSDAATGDRGKLRITFQNCWWAPGCKARMPRVRFGQVHIVNNYFNSTASASCIQAGSEANLLIEGNVFENVKNPVDLMDNRFTAVTVRNNQFTGSTSGSNTGSGTAFTPPYALEVAEPGTIVAPITSCAGATLPGPGECSSCSTSQGDSNASTGLVSSLVKHGSGSSSQTINLGESIVSFYYDWSDASTVSVTGMPAGIQVDIDNNARQVVFSGTPTKSGVFAYTVATVGGNTEAVKNGTFTVNANSMQSRLGGSSTSANEANMPELENLSLKVYPNPVENTLTIEGKFEGNWILFDMQNRKVIEGSQSTVQLEGMKQGIYILKVEENMIRIIKNN